MCIFIEFLGFWSYGLVHYISCFSFYLLILIRNMYDNWVKNVTKERFEFFLNTIQNSSKSRKYLSGPHKKLYRKLQAVFIFLETISIHWFLIFSNKLVWFRPMRSFEYIFLKLFASNFLSDSLFPMEIKLSIAHVNWCTM